MTDIIAIILCIVGTLATLVAAIGILRMPDFYTRLSVTVKASTVGSGLLLVCAAIYFGLPDVTNRAMAIVLFLILTAPVAGHMIGRAAYMSKTKLWDDTALDEMENMYDEEHHLYSDINEKKTENEKANKPNS